MSPRHNEMTGNKYRVMALLLVLKRKTKRHMYFCMCFFLFNTAFLVLLCLFVSDSLTTVYVFATGPKKDIASKRDDKNIL